MSKVEVEIREAKPDDVESVVNDLWFPLAREMEEVDSYNSLRDEELVREGALGHKCEFIEDDERKIFVAEIRQENEFAGYVGVKKKESPPIFTRGKQATVTEVYVREEYRGNGIATRLMERAEDWAEERSCEHLELLVNSDNQPAISLYEDLGFEAKRYNMMKKLD